MFSCFCHSNARIPSKLIRIDIHLLVYQQLTNIFHMTVTAWHDKCRCAIIILGICLTACKQLPSCPHQSPREPCLTILILFFPLATVLAVLPSSSLAFTSTFWCFKSLRMTFEWPLQLAKMRSVRPPLSLELTSSLLCFYNSTTTSAWWPFTLAKMRAAQPSSSLTFDLFRGRSEREIPMLVLQVTELSDEIWQTGKDHWS